MLVNGNLWPFSLGRWYRRRLGMRLTTKSYWLSLRPSRIGTIIWRVANMRSLSSRTTTIPAHSWIPWAWVPGKTVRLRNSPGITFKSTIARERLMLLLMPFPPEKPGPGRCSPAENSKILHHLQASLTRAVLVGISLSALAVNSSEAPAAGLFPIHKVLICGTYVLPKLCRFWEELRGELAKEGLYQQASIGGLRLRLPDLQVEDREAWGIRKQGLKYGWKDIEGVLHREHLPYLLEITRTEIISGHHDNPLAGHFGIE